MRPKHGKKLGGDGRVNKNDYQASEKLTDRQLETEWGPQTKRADVDGLLAVKR